MKKKSVAPKRASRPARQKPGYRQLVSAISTVNTQMVGRVATMANQALVLRNWVIGAYIVEYEQHGRDRAKYGAELLPTLARDLAAKDLRGFGLSMLEGMRRLYLLYPQIGTAIPKSVLSGPHPSKLNFVTSGHEIQSADSWRSFAGAIHAGTIVTSLVDPFLGIDPY